MKYVGIWWKCTLEINLGRFAKHKNSLTQELIPSGKHGATTENTKRYMICSQNGFDGVLVEGWNVGWEDWFGNWKKKF
jgi:hypothetical protein